MSKFLNNYQISTLYGEIKYNKDAGIKYTMDNISHVTIDIESHGNHVAINVSPELSSKTNSKIKDESIIQGLLSKLTNFFSS
jgi:hypothetical protein